MADITFTGLASGVNTSDIVTKLMAVERVPVDNLNTDKDSEANRLKAFGQLNTMFSDLKTAASAMSITSQVRTTKATLSSESAFTVTSDGAVPGSYSVTVTQLAQVQKDISGGYASNSTSIFGTGSVTVNGTAVAIDASNNSLQGLMSAINAVTDTTGVSASIVNDGSSASPYRLVLTGKDASTNFTVTSTLKDSGGKAIPLSTTTVQDAQKAELTIDGIKVVSNSNTITGAIAGLTLNLNATSPVPDSSQPTQYTPTKVDVAADTGALKDKISAFVSSYNKIMNWIVAGYAQGIPAIAASSSTTDTTSTSTTATAETPTDAQYSQLLRGDATVNSIKRGMQSILTDAVNSSGGSLHILSDIGISTNQDGTLNLNNTKLDTALQNNFDGITKLLAGDNSVDGVMKKFNSYLLNVTSTTTGMYAAKRDQYTRNVKTLDDQITQKTARLDQMEATMKARFTAMETLVSGLNSQSSFLTQWIDSYNTSTKA